MNVYMLEMGRKHPLKCTLVMVKSIFRHMCTLDTLFSFSLVASFLILMASQDQQLGHVSRIQIMVFKWFPCGQGLYGIPLPLPNKTCYKCLRINVFEKAFRSAWSACSHKDSLVTALTGFSLHVSLQCSEVPGVQRWNCLIAWLERSIVSSFLCLIKESYLNTVQANGMWSFSE